ncbi:hypothetical protein NADFUDRAFT_81869 [Nadsonia fulvescens var. elongata DSM 6958]|uniref:Uncharacterized protein n=1 Tax=Nadsonia fulvescens var. elongata DSM 6958 TaxID=857566 RepID=A0A1E3PPL0_9ASCO|nr:hypothetical protein NADFUDRAFT_81869 [Nadsonia fulvescens var. elongata DSM 6958]
MGSLYGRNPLELESLRGSPLTVIFKPDTGSVELKGVLYNVDPISGTIIIYHDGELLNGGDERDYLTTPDRLIFEDTTPSAGRYSVVLSDSVLELRFE